MLNLPFHHSNGLAQEVFEVHMLREPHGPLKQVHRIEVSQKFSNLSNHISNLGGL